MKHTYQIPATSLPPDGRSSHLSRYSIFHNSASSNMSHQRDSSLPYTRQSTPERHPPYNQSLSTSERNSISPPGTNIRGFSPFRAFPSGLQYNSQEGDIRRVGTENRWQSPSGSPLPLRSQFQGSQEPVYGNTSPIVLQRFYHQQKQQQKEKEAEEAAREDPGKRRFASYIKLQLSGDRSGRSSRHQSPEPPPRFNRGLSVDNQSPLAARQHFLETNVMASPSLSRRYVSPSPPVPPPRRLSESTSVPGSPQHLRARFHYTPEPQRRLYQNNDVSS